MKASNFFYTCVCGLLLGGVSLNGQVFNFLLSGSQVVTLPQATGSAGFATVSLNGDELSWSVQYEGTLSTPTNAHFHGPAAAGSTAGVALGIPGFTSSPIIGSAMLTAGQKTDLLAGNWYVNIHTPQNPGGELRGQVVSQLSFTPTMLLSGSQEVPGNQTRGAGAALVVYNTDTNLLSWNIAFEGLSAAVTGMHFHGPGAAGVNAGVQVNVGTISGLLSESNGSTTISELQEADLLNGLWYLNVHTSTFPGGEIRGQVVAQVVPEPSVYASILGMLALAGILYRRRAR